jgi:monoamine oxidase
MDTRDPEILIIGAGAAGLSAAAELEGHGVSTLVLEARSRPFGRADTVRDPAWPIPIEHGAEFLHDDAPLTRRLAREAGARAETVPNEHYWVENGRARPTPDMEALVQRAVAREGRRARDRSLADVFAAMTAARRGRLEPARFFVEGYHAADLDEISAKSLLDPGGEEPTQRRIVEGYAAALGVLHRRVAPAVRLDTTATQVEWRRGRVRVHAQSTGTHAPFPPIDARAGIVTVPLGVLHAGSLVFSPRPSHWTRALPRLETGTVEKVVFLFRKPFWLDSPAWRGRRRVPPFWHARGLAFPTWWTMAPRTEPVLVAWAGGPAARALSGLGDAEIVDRAVSCLTGMLGVRRSAVEASVVATQRHDWTNDAFSRGAYSYVGVGGLAAQRSLARPVEDTLVLAGEALDPERVGTVEGALASGRRAARALLRKMKKKSAAA